MEDLKNFIKHRILIFDYGEYGGIHQDIPLSTLYNLRLHVENAIVEQQRKQQANTTTC
jgi:hypothetical protein